MTRKNFERYSAFLNRAFAQDATANYIARPSEGLAAIYPGVFSGFQEAPSNIPEIDWIDLGIGHQMAPPAVVEEALLRSFSGTQSPADQLRLAIQQKYRDEQGHDIDPHHNVLLTGGARVGFAVGMLGLLDPGDIVVIPDPDYIGLTHMASAVGAKVRRLPLTKQMDGGFTVDLDRLTQAMSGARLFAFTNPNNPMGMMWSGEMLAELVSLADQQGTFLLTSEIYDELLFCNHKFVSLAGRADPERSLIINGTAKAYNLAGYGVGWAICGCALHAALSNLMTLTHHAQPARPAMQAAAAVLDASVRNAFPLQVVTRMQEFATRLIDIVSRHVSLPPPMPQAGQFLFPYFGGDDLSLAKALKREAGLLTVPGQIWGAGGRGHLRLALMLDAACHDEALSRLDHALTKHLV